MLGWLRKNEVPALGRNGYRSLKSLAKKKAGAKKIARYWPPRSKSIFVTLGLPGSAAQTKTPTDCCASIFRAAPICLCTARPSSVLSQGSSMKGRESPCSIRRRLRSLQNVLQRSVELAPRSSHSPIRGYEIGLLLSAVR